MHSQIVNGRQGRSAAILPAVLLVAAGAVFFVARAGGPDQVFSSRAPGTFAEIRIHQTRPKLLSDVYAREQDFETYRRTHARLLKGHFVLQSALRSPEIGRLEVIKQQRQPIEWLEENLVVEFPDTEFIRLSLRGHESAEAAAILNAVVRAYTREVVEKEEEQRRSRLSQLEKIAAGVQAEIDRLSQDVQRQRELMAAQELNTEMLNPELIRNEYTRLRLKQVQLEAELAADQAQLEGQRDPEGSTAGEQRRELEMITRRIEALQVEFPAVLDRNTLSKLPLARIKKQIARKERILDQLQDQIERMTLELNAPIGIEVFREAMAVE